VKRHLSPDGSFYGNVSIGRALREDGNWQGFPVVRRPLEFYERACLNAGLSLKLLGPVRDLGHVSGRPPDLHEMLQIRHIL